MSQLALRSKPILKSNFSQLARKPAFAGKPGSWQHPRAQPTLALHQEKAQRTLVIYDFDLSMANETSDTWMLKQFDDGISQEFQTRLDNGFPCWVEEINDMFNKLHSRGVSGQQIASKIRDIPVFDANLQMINALGHAGATQMVVSDANTIYIRSFLENYGLLRHFHSIYSNPSSINPVTGHFSVKRFLSQPHSCHWCDDAPNMCKGQIFESILELYGHRFEQVIFVSDGTNDYCAAMRMRASDTVMCRRDLGLNNLFNKHGVDSVAATVQFWSHGDDLRQSVEARLM